MKARFGTFPGMAAPILPRHAGVVLVSKPKPQNEIKKNIVQPHSSNLSPPPADFPTEPTQTNRNAILLTLLLLLLLLLLLPLLKPTEQRPRWVPRITFPCEP